MALQSSGPISFSQINTELGVASNTTRNIGSASSRGLSGVASGQTSISNFYGKANRAAISYTYSATTANASLNVTSIAGYIAGKSDITINVNSGVYLYATTSGNAGLTLSGGTTGDTVTLVNNGFIMGMGGTGGSYNTAYVAPTSSGTALTLGYPTRITNNSYIAGGGGGGGGAGTGGAGTGGGGAGGGAGGFSQGTSALTAGGTGGSPGSAGGNGNGWQSAPTGAQIAYGGGAGGGGGTYVNQGSVYVVTGGGGGRILPGTGGVGSSGAFGKGGNGGGSNTVGLDGTYASPFGGGGGGGGWGAAGGIGKQTQSGANNPGSAGGKAIHLNGHSVTWLTTGTVYGAVS
jgi:hypothetical protein